MEKETVYAVIITDRNNQIGGCFSTEEKAKKHIGNNWNFENYALRGYLKSK